jgi:hypothetical protein
VAEFTVLSRHLRGRNSRKKKDRGNVSGSEISNLQNKHSCCSQGDPLRYSHLTALSSFEMLTVVRSTLRPSLNTNVVLLKARKSSATHFHCLLPQELLPLLPFLLMVISFKIRTAKTTEIMRLSMCQR